MIFNINEISEKIKAIKREKRPAQESPKRRFFPRLAISPQASAAKTGPKIFKIAKEGQDRRKKIAKIIVSNYKLNKTSAKVLLALLYWSSGAKYPANNFVAFSNSDPNLVKMFLNLLRTTFPIAEAKIKTHLQLYTSHDQKKVTRYWSELLNIPVRQFYKPTIKKTKRNIRHSNYFGTCTVRYYSLDLLLKIMEIYEELANAI
jgi:hypothetical protein